MSSNADWKNIYAPASSTYYYILSIYWEETNYSIEGNYSTVWCRARLESRGIGFSGNGSSCLYVYWHDNHTNEDTLINSVIPSSMSNYDTFDVTGSLNVWHNNDGSLSGYAFAQWVKKSNNSYVPASDTIATSWTALTTIPRVSDLYNASGYIGQGISFSLNKKDDSFLTTLTYSFGNLSDTIVYQTPNNPITWSIPDSFYTQIPNQATGSGTITAYTYTSNGTYIGSSTAYIYVTAYEPTTKPSISITSVVDTNQNVIALTGSNAKLVQGVSTARVSFTHQTQYSATVQSIVVNGKTLTASEIQHGYCDFRFVSTDTFTATITDSRGYQVSATPVVKPNSDYIRYVPLTLSATFERSTPTDSQVILTYYGDYFNGSFGATSNSLVVRYKYKEVGTSSYSSWITLTPHLDGNSYYQKVLIANDTSAIEDLDPPQTIEEEEHTSGGTGRSVGETPATDVFDYTKQYEFVIEAYDLLYLSTPITITQVIPQGKPIYWWDNDTFTVEADMYLKEKRLIDIIHPVGSVYITLDNTSPSTLFGGTWEQVSQGRTLLGAGHPSQNSDPEFGTITSDQYTWTFNAGDTAGAYRHSHGLDDNGYAKLSIHQSYNQIQYHEVNTVGYTANYGMYGSNGFATSVTDNYGAGLGGETAYSWSIQPYFVVYIWKRTA